MVAIRHQLLQPGDGWAIVTVGDLAETRTGRAFPNKYQGNASGEVPYFKVADMNEPANSRNLTTTRNWLDNGGIVAVKPKICPPGTVVFPIIGAALSTEKRRLLVQPSAFDQNLMGLVPNDRVMPEYLLALMSSIQLSDLTQPGAVPSVNQKIVSEIPVPLAPRELQKQIVETIAALQCGVDATRTEASGLRAARAGLASGLLDRTIEIKSSGLEI
jgi:type I restriction enzyme S subunit